MSAAPVPDGPAEGVYARRTRLRRSEILASALRTFGAKGFYKASLADVAGAAGITAAGLLHHFKTKDALLIELLRMRDATDLDAATGGERPRGRAFLQHLIDTAARNSHRLGTTQLYAVLSAEGATEDHPAQSWFRTRYADLRSMINTALREAVDDHEIAADLDPESTATSIIAAMDGLQIQWLYEPDEIDMATRMADVITALVRPVDPFVVTDLLPVDPLITEGPQG